MGGLIFGVRRLWAFPDICGVLTFWKYHMSVHIYAAEGMREAADAPFDGR